MFLVKKEDFPTFLDHQFHLKNLLISLAKSVLIPLRLTAAASATNAAI